MSRTSLKEKTKVTYKSAPENWVQQSKMVSMINWVVPSNDELKFNATAGKGRQAWVSQQFRYCPICLEHGYHSYLHQLTPLQTCPIHAALLSTLCSSCGRLNLPIVAAPELLSRPYLCEHCGLPISGAEPSALRERHLELRQSSVRIAQGFDPIAKWWDAAAPIRQDLHKFIVSRFSGLYSVAYDDLELLRSMVAVRIPPVQGLAGPKYPAMTELNWRLLVRRSEGDLHKDRSMHFAWGSNIKLGVPLTAYKCAVRIIERWIGVPIPNSGAGTTFQTAEGEPTSAKRLQLRALVHMKEQLGDTVRTCAGLYNMPRFQFVPYENRTQRMGWLAQYFALYAAWYHFLSRNHSIAEWDRFAAQGHEAIGIYCSIDRVGESVVGKVLFPYIEGFSEMCMESFKLSRHYRAE